MVDSELSRALAEARALGFLGPGPVEDHLAHSEAFLELWQPAPTGLAIDVGSGGGVPGLVLAVRLPGWRWVLLDVNRRRTSFLARAVASIGSLRGRVDVVRASTVEASHDQRHREAYDIATARSFGPPALTAEHAGAFVKVGGRLLVSEPPDGVDRWAAGFLSTVGLELTARREAPPRVVALERVTELDRSLPRR